MKDKLQIKYVLCLNNKDCEDLEIRKIYQVIPDESSSSEGYIRVIDESGEDYLYPEDYFVPVKIPQKAQSSILSLTK